MCTGGQPGPHSPPGAFESFPLNHAALSSRSPRSGGRRFGTRAFFAPPSRAPSRLSAAPVDRRARPDSGRPWAGLVREWEFEVERPESRGPAASPDAGGRRTQQESDFRSCASREGPCRGAQETGLSTRPRRAEVFDAKGAEDGRRAGTAQRERAALVGCGTHRESVRNPSSCSLLASRMTSIRSP
jgi:hypothetical protein